MEMEMDINRSKLLIVSLFLITICFWFLPFFAHTDSRGISVISDLSHQSGKLGSYRALLIGINDYNDPKIPDLETAVNDASAMAKLLRERYGFRVKLLLDRKATKKAIYRALRSLASSTKPDDSILIYYAGHGDLDRLTNDGWWIPADAKGGDSVTYLNNFLVQTYIRSMKARHVLLVSDSCYSGTLFGQARAMPQVIDDKYYLNLYNEKSRWGMTSGNKTPVSDRGAGSHSVFAYQLLKELTKNEKSYISTQEIYTRIAPIVSNNSEQTPLCRPIRNTGDQGGEFVFVASSSAIVEKPSSRKSKAYLSVESNVSGARVSVDGRNVGNTSLSDVEITSGEHRIRVEKDGYEPYTKKIRFEKGRTRDLYVILDPKVPLKGRLYVDTQPDNARVRILNIGPAFNQGMPLDAGRYHMEVSANGYETQKMWVSLTAGQDKTLDIRLKRIGQYQPVASQGKKISNSLGMEFVYIAPGKFMMGSPSNEPSRDDDEKQHRVTLTKGFYIQTTEVTVGQWRTFVRDTGYKSEAETGGGAYIWTGSKWEKKKGTYWDHPGFSQTDNHPVTCVSWNDANAFIKWLSRKEGKIYRLPTEAEWEYAARAGTDTPFSFGRCLSTDQANYDGNYPLSGCSKGKYRKSTIPVSSLTANTWGLYDMHGNVWEWCQDWYGDYPSSSVTDPAGSSGGSYRVNRGGSWYNSARNCRSAYRVRFTPGSRSSYLGFRLLRNP
jgi:formylglycine-generating enzyme required for sulfatase activity